MGGGSTTKTSTKDPEARATQKLQREGVLQPLIATFMPQWLGSLMSGTSSQQQLPMVQNEVSGIRSNTSSAVQAIKAMLSSKGGTGTPFGTKQVNDATVAGEQEAAGVGPNMALDWFRQIPGMITGTGGTLVNAGGTKTQSMSGGSDGGSGLGQMFGQLGSMALMYGMNANKKTA